MSVHRSATAGYEVAAARYVAGRPGYPPAVGAWLTDVVGLGPGRRALDLGSGSGKFLPCLLATGATVIAVEPVAEMREQLARLHPGVEALAADAEHLPMGAASLDAVVCAQSFHWFASEAALADIRRVLRTDGVLGLIWNVRDEEVGWVAALSAITDRYGGDTPRQRTAEWRRLFPAPGFVALGETEVRHEHRGSAERVIVDRTLSVSFIAALPATERERVEREVRALVAETPELQGDDVSFPYRTLTAAFRRIGPA